MPGPTDDPRWMLPAGPSIALDAPTRTWTRFAGAVAVLTGIALTVGLALSYASVYHVAYDAGFDRPWITTSTWQLRPAHLFPLTLDVPVLAGYAGTIALAGRRSVIWARIVLLACAAATIAAQVADGAGLITHYVWVRALVHGWPPALGILTAHLLVKILQALGLLIPPVTEAERPSWVARSWAWGVQAVADMRGAVRALKRGDMDRDGETAARTDTATDATSDAGPDSQPDVAADATAAIGGDTMGDSRDATDADNQQVRPKVTPKLTLRERRVVERVLRGELTRGQAAKQVGKSSRTVERWVADARAANRTEAAS